MDMVHGLPAVRASVQHHAESTRIRCADGSGDSEQLRRQRRVDMRERRHVVMVVPRDHEDVHRRLRIDVVERHDPLAFMDEGRRDFSGGDLAEQAAHGVIVFRSGPTRRARKHNARRNSACRRGAEHGRTQSNCFGTRSRERLEFLR